MIAAAASICILTWNQLAVTRLCLRSLARTELPPGTELIFVDNGSTDGTVDELLALQKASPWPGVRISVLLNSENAGCASGRNMAAALARNEYLIFIDNDVEIEDHRWLARIVDFLAGNAEVGVMGAKLIYADTRRLQSAGVAIDARANIRHIGNDEAPSSENYNRCRTVQGVDAACLAVRTELFRELGGFDAAYDPVNYEDLDLCFRVRQAGRVVAYNPAVEIIHHAHSTTNNTDVLPIRRVNIVNQKRFREQWGDLLRRDALSMEAEGGLDVQASA